MHYSLLKEHNCLKVHVHARTHTVHMALVGYLIVFSFVTKPGQNLEFLLWGTIVLLLQVPHNKLWRTRPHLTYGTCGVLHCLLFCDQTRPNLRISLVGYHCAIEFPCGVPLFYCCKYPTTYGVPEHAPKHLPWRTSHCSRIVWTAMSSLVLYTKTNAGTPVSLLLKSPV